jgi:hypothetical protein
MNPTGSDCVALGRDVRVHGTLRSVKYPMKRSIELSAADAERLHDGVRGVCTVQER